MKFSRKNSAYALSRTDVLVIVAICGLLLCLDALWLLKARSGSRSVCCNCNLKQVDISFRIWSNDHNDNNPMQISITNGGTRELIAGGEGFSTFQIMSNELASPFILVCPGDSTRLPAKSFSTNFNDQAVSYFIGLDATDAAPQMFLSGDRNLTKNGLPVKHGVHEFTTDQPIGWTGEFHGDRGNIGLADGSVQVLSSAGLKNTLQNTGVATNRLAIP